MLGTNDQIIYLLWSIYYIYSFDRKCAFAYLEDFTFICVMKSRMDEVKKLIECSTLMSVPIPFNGAV